MSNVQLYFLIANQSTNYILVRNPLLIPHGSEQVIRYSELWVISTLAALLFPWRDSSKNTPSSAISPSYLSHQFVQCRLHLPCTYPLDCSCGLSKDDDLFLFTTKGLLSSTMQSVLGILMRVFNNSSQSKYHSGTTHFSCLCKDTKVICKILFLL